MNTKTTFEDKSPEIHARAFSVAEMMESTIVPHNNFTVINT